MKWNKNPVRAMKKLHSDIQSLRLMAKNDQHTIPEDWDSEKKNVLVIVTSQSKGGAQRVACQVASLADGLMVVLAVKIVVAAILYFAILWLTGARTLRESIEWFACRLWHS